MRRVFSVLTLLLLLTTAAFADSAPVSQTIRLNNIAAAGLYRLRFSRHPSWNSLTCDFRDNSVTATGSADNVAVFVNDLRQADVSPTQYKIAAHMIYFQANNDGHPVQSDCGAFTLYTTAGTTADYSTQQADKSGFTFRVKADPNGPCSTYIVAETLEMGAGGAILASGANSEVVPFDKTTRITVALNTTAQSAFHDALTGKIVDAAGEKSGYYVDITPSQVSIPR